jgi:uncharacterized cupin superfamily protein
MNEKPPLAVDAMEVPPRARRSLYPEPFASRMAGRTKRKLGDHLGISSFGVNLTTLAPGAQTALLHRHTVQEEMVYVLEGRPTLVTDEGEVALAPGMCAGFIPDGPAHHVVNRTDQVVVILEIGDRRAGDAGSYPNDDLQATLGPDGQWLFTRKDGTPY